MRRVLCRECCDREPLRLLMDSTERPPRGTGEWLRSQSPQQKLQRNHDFDLLGGDFRRKRRQRLRSRHPRLGLRVEVSVAGPRTTAIVCTAPTRLIIRRIITTPFSPRRRAAAGTV